MMTRILGFCGCCAEAGATIAAAKDASSPSNMFLRLAMIGPPARFERYWTRGPLELASVARRIGAIAACASYSGTDTSAARIHRSTCRGRAPLKGRPLFHIIIDYRNYRLSQQS